MVRLGIIGLAGLERRLGETVIEVSNVWYRYNNEQDWVLRGVSLRISRGEVVAIIGESGAGKTTLAKHMNGLLKPHRGYVRVLGMDTRKTPTSKIAAHVGYVFQSPDAQIFSGTIYEEMEERIKRALKLVDLDKPLNISPHILSFGERHRLAIASILAMEPDVLILDEPFAGIDYKRSLQLLRALKNLTEEGRSIVLIGHDLQLIGEIADRVIVMKNGEVIREGSVEDILGDIEFLTSNGYIPLQITIIGSEIGVGRYVRVSDAVRDIEKRVRGEE
ncbi:MAG: ABC transporter ATP-binding protein [Sulfolobales archaeon]